MIGGVRGSLQPPFPRPCWKINQAGQLVEGQVRKYEDTKIGFQVSKAF
jgi:hypothetical protein